ncbi:anti sigma factor C-terminal domain-containing protein [Lysinibacillus fusiformis]|uniref:anti sigma factor C-terminal domain-containing protein n=1 Tax=Lysinibacillus fusiformis TaxID=28031 RepID=UPI00148BB0AE|nr:hypothetical protein [Lysinibacillus fusiformis]
MREDEILKDIFEFSNNEKNIIKKAKRKSYLRMTMISGLVTVIAVTLLIIFKLQITPYLLNKEILAKDAYYQVYGANTYLSPWNTDIKLIGSTATSTQYKLLNGRPVFKKIITLESTPHETYIQPHPNKTYTYYGQNVMNFYHPKIDYENVAEDGLILNNKLDNKIIEMGISFDQVYTMSEVNKMLPQGVSLQWYWLDTFSNVEISSMQKSVQPYTEIPAHVFLEDEIVGIRAFSNTGEKYDNPLKEFKESIQFTMENNSEYKKEMKTILDSITDNNNINIIGAVVVGDAATLSKLSKAPFIRASSLGASIDSY